MLPVECTLPAALQSTAQCALTSPLAALFSARRCLPRVVEGLGIRETSKKKRKAGPDSSIILCTEVQPQLHAPGTRAAASAGGEAAEDNRCVDAVRGHMQAVDVVKKTKTGRGASTSGVSAGAGAGGAAGAGTAATAGAATAATAAGGGGAAATTGAGIAAGPMAAGRDKNGQAPCDWKMERHRGSPIEIEQERAQSEDGFAVRVHHELNSPDWSFLEMKAGGGNQRQQQHGSNRNPFECSKASARLEFEPAARPSGQACSRNKRKAFGCSGNIRNQVPFEIGTEQGSMNHVLQDTADFRCKAAVAILEISDSEEEDGLTHWTPRHARAATMVNGDRVGVKGSLQCYVSLSPVQVHTPTPFVNRTNVIDLVTPPYAKKHP